MVTFCKYRSSNGFCGYVAVYGHERCKKHLGKVSKVKIASPKFRGKSKFNEKINGWKSVLE